MKSLLKKQDIIEQIVIDKKKGLSDIEIGKKYGVNYKQIEQAIIKSTGVSVSSLNKRKKIRALAPKDFKEETTTVWSFKNRGNWATHSGEYRGNWSPYIPRNVILKYSNKGDLVLDQFCGAGTTAVECKLLGRRCIGLDINEKAIELAKENIDFELPSIFGEVFEPELLIGDARDLHFLKDNSIDLICTHPPYADIIHYTDNKEGDLSYCNIEEFLQQMRTVAKECFRVLKPNKNCAILIGDIRKNKYIVPLGFRLLNVFLESGFKLKELVIKRQHNCKTTGFWYERSFKFNFLLLAHEYLFIFEKPQDRLCLEEQAFSYNINEQKFKIETPPEKFETTTVWIFPEKDYNNLIYWNLINRYCKNGNCKVIDNLSVYKKQRKTAQDSQLELLYLNFSLKELNNFFEELKRIIEFYLPNIQKNGYIAIRTQDRKSHGYTIPLAKMLIDEIVFTELKLKEIVILTTEESSKDFFLLDKGLSTVHEYLLLYEKIK